MRKIWIDNAAAPALEPMIESRAAVMLGTLLPSLRRVELAIARSDDGRHSEPLYVCEIEALELSGVSHKASNAQADPTACIEGAVGRVRRQILRASGAKGSAFKLRSGGR